MRRCIRNPRQLAWNSRGISSNLSSDADLLCDLRQVTSRAVPQFPLVLNRAGDRELPTEVL